ncbi:hypothetical protein MNB_SV-6-790 [hydrothermal vent metagenome]|uniref:Outer membrane porin, OprD family n=1 Tax=hydrothermal vent metagenome TaxID=652676 RepID=A0A1W1C2W3_9ZZZZ
MRLQYTIITILYPCILLSNSLTEAIGEGRVEAEGKVFAYDIDKPTPNDAYATAIGGYIKYSSDTNRSIYGAVRFHTSLPIGGNTNPQKTALFDDDGNGLIVNSEAYIGWSNRDGLLKVGNLMLNTPMMNDDTTRIVPWSYQGLLYTGKIIPDLKAQISHIIKIRSHTSSQYIKESASGEIGDGITMLGIHYSGIDDLDLHGYYYYAPDLYSTLFLQADYRYKLDDEDILCASIQYVDSGDGGEFADSENKNGGDDINLVALRVGYNTDSLNISLNYSQNFGLSGITKGYGGLAKIHTTSMIANGRANYKPETWMVKMLYELPATTWGISELGFNYTRTRVHDSRGSQYNAHYLHLKQTINDKISIFLRYESFDYLEEKADERYLRLIFAYRL